MGSSYSHVSNSEQTDEEETSLKSSDVIESAPVATHYEQRHTCHHKKNCVSLFLIIWVIIAVVQIISMVGVWESGQDILSAIRSIPTRKVCLYWPILLIRIGMDGICRVRQ